MAGRQGSGIAGIEYGKVKLYSSQDDIDKLYDKLESLLSKWGYPEIDLPEKNQDSHSTHETKDEDSEASADESSDEIGEETEEPKDEIDEVLEKLDSPEEDLAESPWMQALRKRKPVEDDHSG